MCVVCVCVLCVYVCVSVCVCIVCVCVLCVYVTTKFKAFVNVPLLPKGFIS